MEKLIFQNNFSKRKPTWQSQVNLQFRTFVARFLMFTHLVLLSELRFLIPVDTWLSFGWLSLNLLLLMFMIQWNVLKLMSNFVLDISLKTTKMIYNLLKKENQGIFNIWRKLLKDLLLKLHILRPSKFCKK